MGHSARSRSRSPSVHTIYPSALHDMATAARHESQHLDDVYTNTRFLRFRRFAGYEIGS